MRIILLHYDNLGKSNNNCAAANTNLAACTAANIPSTCTVTDGGTNNDCTAAADVDACTAATASGGGDLVANACAANIQFGSLVGFTARQASELVSAFDWISSVCMFLYLIYIRHSLLKIAKEVHLETAQASSYTVELGVGLPNDVTQLNTYLYHMPCNLTMTNYRLYHSMYPIHKNDKILFLYFVEKNQ